MLNHREICLLTNEVVRPVGKLAPCIKSHNNDFAVHYGGAVVLINNDELKVLLNSKRKILESELRNADNPPGHQHNTLKYRLSVTDDVLKALDKENNHEEQTGSRQHANNQPRAGDREGACSDGAIGDLHV